MIEKNCASPHQIHARKAESNAAQRSPIRLLVAVLAALTAGCENRSQPDVVVYTSVDQQFASEILKRFEARFGVKVHAVFDTEAAKTTGLVRRLQRETTRPRCDVWWSSEPFGTIELARNDVFEPYDGPAAADIPDAWKDSKRRWTGFAARARALAYHTERVDPDSLPKTWREFGAADWANRLAIANPLFGTTRGHVAAMFAHWGKREATEFLKALRAAGCRIEDGNSMAVQSVVTGKADICFTDSDDVWVAQRRGRPVGMTYPTLEPDGPIVWIPNTVALVRGGPNPDQGRRLVDFLLGAETELALSRSDSRNVPVRASLHKKLDFGSPMPTALDFERIADALPDASRAVRDILIR